MSDSLVILLHGVGSSGADIGGLAPALAPSLPNTKFVSPDGPGRFNAGHQWFCVTGVTTENRPARVAAARPSFDAILSDIIGREGFAGRLDRVALVGFSQGSIMALDAIASGRWSVAGVVAFSGRLASPEPLEPVKGSKLLLVHGTEDHMMPVSEVANAEAKLSPLGVVTTSFIQPGLGHSVSAEGVAEAAKFLGKLFA